MKLTFKRGRCQQNGNGSRPVHDLILHACIEKVMLAAELRTKRPNRCKTNGAHPDPIGNLNRFLDAERRGQIAIHPDSRQLLQSVAAGEVQPEKIGIFFRVTSFAFADQAESDLVSIDLLELDFPGTPLSKIAA